jgi:hypothetical protein
LQRLDRLTHDEARTTAAETLKVVYGLVQEMSKQVHSTCDCRLLRLFLNRRKGIHGQCPGRARYAYWCLCSDFAADQESEILHQMVSDKNKSKRQLFSTFPPMTGKPNIDRQVTSCGEIFEAGSLLLTRGKITTSLANLGTARPQSGSFKVTRSPNGNRPDRVHFYGFMGNVSWRLVLELSQTLTTFLLRSGRRKERILVRKSYRLSSMTTHGVNQFHHY